MQVTLYGLSIYIQVITIDEKRGHEFEGGLEEMKGKGEMLQLN